MYHAIDQLYKRKDWTKPKKLRKHYLINGNYMAMAEYLYEKTKTDIFVYLEDDMTYHSDLIERFVDYYNNNNFDKYCYERIAPYTYSPVPKKPDTPYTARQWGHYGLVRTRKQMAEYFRMMKFQRYFESGDALAGYYCQMVKRNYFVMNLARHFGKDKKIPA